ncbi:unnamed protein product [Effrenium voratum]|nr:unnamed protein product [Effrenium voratum]
MELQAGRGLLVSAGAGHKPPAMDLEKALGIFAFETWVCGKNSLPAPSFAVVLQRAQELVEEDKSTKALAILPDSEVTPTTVACGMAVSAGLLAAGCVASAAGYPTLGEPTFRRVLSTRSPAKVLGIRRHPDPANALIPSTSCSVGSPACRSRELGLAYSRMEED